MQYGKAMTATMAHFMYCECAEGILNQEQKLDSPMTLVGIDIFYNN